jgi:hypothetical protein
LVTVSHQSSTWAFRAALPVQDAGPQVVPDVLDLILHVSLCLGEDDVGVDIPTTVGSTCADIVHRGPLTACPSRTMAAIRRNHASVAVNLFSASCRPVRQGRSPLLLGSGLLRPRAGVINDAQLARDALASPCLVQSRSSRAG